jgi:hypothetical protein
VLTSLEFQLHPVKDIYGGPAFFELKDGPALLSLYNEFIKDADERFGGRRLARVGKAKHEEIRDIGLQTGQVPTSVHMADLVARWRVGG